MGLFALVLHTHLPYVRRNGVWPSGEDFFHQAATESYLPLLSTLERLAADATEPFLTLGMTPLIAHQLQDPYLLRELAIYLGTWDLRAWWQVANYDGVYAEEFKEIAGFYARHARAQAAVLESSPGGLAKRFGAIEDAGAIEIIGGPASHPVLPEITEPSLLAAQVSLGMAEHERFFGRRPRGVWLPECAYRPGLGIEETLASADISHFVVDGPTMIRSAGPDATFTPAFVRDSDVAAFGRNLDVTYRVWSPTGGYPTNKWYREYFAYDMVAGFKNWRVTSIKTPIVGKKPYDPARAVERAHHDAEEFVGLLDEWLSAYEDRTGSEGVVVACYDTELFGHWWFEGPAWLERVFTLLRDHPRVRATTLEGALASIAPPQPVDMVEGSWGFRKDLRSWIAPETEDLWRALAEAESESVRIARKFATAEGGERLALEQMVREQYLLQSSDWPFMVLRGRNEGYARERFWSHHDRWSQLASGLLDRKPSAVLAKLAASLHDVDNVFPSIDPSAIVP